MTDETDPNLPKDQAEQPREPRDDDPLPEQPISASAGTYYRNARYLMTALMLFMGAYFLYDGFVGYPRHNLKVTDLTRQRDELNRAGQKTQADELTAKLTELHGLHSDWDILLQKLLGAVLVPGGIVFIVRVLRNSRGQIRIENDTLHVPGHPAIPLADITGIDNALWDRKGIAFVEYATAGVKGAARLDDFVYQRDPIDDIHRLVMHHLEKRAG